MNKITGQDVRAAFKTSLPIMVTFVVLGIGYGLLMEKSGYGPLWSLASGLMTLATRIVPVLILGRGEKVPEYILYLGRVVPYTAMGLLIVYCLKDVSILD